MRYHDFVFLIGSWDGEAYRIRVVESPAGEGAGRFVPPSEILEGVERGSRASVRIRKRIAPDRDVRPVSGQVDPPTPEELGAKLYSSLFSGQVGALFERSQGSVGSDPTRGLRVKVKLDPNAESFEELKNLPWELLRKSETDEFLALGRRNPIIRYLEVPQPVHRIVLPRRLRILAAVSSPKGLDPLDLDGERRLLERALAAKRKVELDFLEHPTMLRLRRALVEKTHHVLHFMGHGGIDVETGEGLCI